MSVPFRIELLEKIEITLYYEPKQDLLVMSIFTDSGTELVSRMKWNLQQLKED